MKPRSWIYAMLLASGLIAAGALAAESNSSRKEYSERYGILSERNIFMRDRSKPVTSRPSSRPVQPTRIRVPEETIVLRGIVIEEGDLRAYFEDMDSGSILKVNSGEAIARGKVSEIEIDSVEYEHAGAKLWIDIGHDLTGKIGADVSSSSSGVSSETISTAAATPTTKRSSTGSAAPTVSLPGDANMTPEQKMKLRRAQELKPK